MAPEASVATAVDILLAGKLVQVMGEVPPSRVGLTIFFEEKVQTNRFAGSSSGGYQQPSSRYGASKPLYEHLQRRY